MKYLSFRIENYRAIKELSIAVDSRLIPLVGVNECGKTTILQAIYAFDYTNDKEYDGRHLKSISNLYDTTDLISSITAKISINKSKLYNYLLNIVKAFQTYRINDGLNEDEFKEEFCNSSEELEIEITRNLNTQKYTTNFSHDFLDDENVIDKFAQEIVSGMPYILYNDDFSDRPPSEIEIPNSKPDDISGWLYIYERLFNKANNHSLFSIIHEADQRRRDSILSDVESVLNHNFSETWQSFSFENKTNKINVELKIIDSSPGKKLQISIVEQLDGKNRYFSVLDRSKGFVWYFNFIMKTRFNPKIIGNAEDTIFLLDEPGSYLHSLAQEKLCEKLKETAKEDGIVIYCTHSHHLLNPKNIPLKNIKIVEKNESKKVILKSLDQFKNKSVRINALQPIYEALELPVHELFTDDSILLLVEGINDKYVLESFIDFPSNIRILPGTSADSILKNIPYMLAYNKKYVCLWDNDDEGSKSMKRAVKEYKPNDEILLQLPLENNSKRRMEDMILSSDLIKIKRELGLDSSVHYDITIPALFFSDEKERTRIVNELSPETKNSFDIVKNMINKIIIFYGENA